MTYLERKLCEGWVLEVWHLGRGRWCCIASRGADDNCAHAEGTTLQKAVVHAIQTWKETYEE